MANQAPKILFVLNGLNNFVSHRIPLAKALQEQGYCIHIAHPKTKEETTNQLNNLEMNLHEYTISRKSLNPLKAISSCLELKKIIKQQKPDLVIAVALKTICFSSLLQRLFFKKTHFIYLFTGLGFLYSSNKLSSKLARFATELIIKQKNNSSRQAYVFQNPDDRNQLLKNKIVSEDNSFIVKSSGIDLSLYQTTDEPAHKHCHIIFAARLLRDKGIIEFIEAIKLLNKRNLDASYIIAGDIDKGNPRSITQEMLDDWQNIPNTKFIGWQKDLKSNYLDANIVCLPSYYREGIPKSLLEALACGRAVITADSPGCRETVVAGKNGLLVKPGDEKSLADALEKLSLDTELRHTMGKQSRILAEQDFAIEKIIKETLSIIKKATKPCAA